MNCAWVLLQPENSSLGLNPLFILETASSQKSLIGLLLKNHNLCSQQQVLFGIKERKRAQLKLNIFWGLWQVCQVWWEKGTAQSAQHLHAQKTISNSNYFETWPHIDRGRYTSAITTVLQFFYPFPVIITLMHCVQRCLYHAICIKTLQFS